MDYIKEILKLQEKEEKRRKELELILSPLNDLFSQLKEDSSISFKNQNVSIKLSNNEWSIYKTNNSRDRDSNIIKLMVKDELIYSFINLDGNLKDKSLPISVNNIENLIQDLIVLIAENFNITYRILCSKEG